MKCLVCERESLSRSLCSKHYQQFRKSGSLLPKSLERQRLDKPEICTNEGCNDKTYAKELCQKHYMRLYRSDK